ncbi:hypothetical protein A5784_09310 [Mycobacterium sp. 852013-50091_SCH5140682]|uniref:hypothetical protein n=1 Tax=Mycobacterium sp. 852013-50091_SCH5140682 TaxID=1834109 RepID=UPI0007EB740F|nr:hypothetical protein [Mycobacterium sp. 852013-50091_SCH5140682]OBC07004.1 hypothetical protein A5784_09310 [Mycobacterium sp. 852013-50091_SCH5140682]
MAYVFEAVTVCDQFSDELREIFLDMLNDAICQGQEPLVTRGFGPRTQSAIRLVADNHPDASVDLIADAYDAFTQEHGPTAQSAPDKPALSTVRSYLRSRRRYTHEDNGSP